MKRTHWNRVPFWDKELKIGVRNVEKLILRFRYMSNE